jgi:hypothetical protein
MGKKSGSKSSRSERNAGRKRAERARQHGLPTRPAPAPPARQLTPEPSDDSYGEARSSDAPLSRAQKRAGIPTLVKVVGGALVVLIGVYLLSRQRDQALPETTPAAEPAGAVSAVASPSTESGGEPAPPSSATSPAPAFTSPSEPPAAVVSVTPPAEPVVVAPVAASPSKPKVALPRVVAPERVPAPVAPGAVNPPAPPAAPTAASKPAAPSQAPVENPY